MQEDTKKKLKDALIVIQMEHPEIKTSDDLQNYFLNVVKPQPLIGVLTDDMNRTKYHFCELREDIDKECIGDLMNDLLNTILLIKTKKQCKFSHKRMKELMKELDAMEAEK